MFKMQRGERRVSTCYWHDEVHHMEGYMANSMLRPYGIGCRMLGPHHTASLGTPHPQPHASNETTPNDVGWISYYEKQQTMKKYKWS